MKVNNIEIDENSLDIIFIRNVTTELYVRYGIIKQALETNNFKYGQTKYLCDLGNYEGVLVRDKLHYIIFDFDLFYQLIDLAELMWDIKGNYDILKNTYFAEFINPLINSIIDSLDEQILWKGVNKVFNFVYLNYLTYKFKDYKKLDIIIK